MTLDEALKKFERHGFTYRISVSKQRITHLLLQNPESKMTIVNKIKENERENIVDWIKDASYKWFGIDI